MARLSVSVSGGYITADIEANGPVLEAALQEEKAEPVLRCAVLMALSALAEGGVWPNAALQSMAAFMARMNNELAGELPQEHVAGALRVSTADRVGGRSQRPTGLIAVDASASGRRAQRSMKDRS